MNLSLPEVWERIFCKNILKKIVDEKFNSLDFLHLGRSNEHAYDKLGESPKDCLSLLSKSVIIVSPFETSEVIKSLILKILNGNQTCFLIDLDQLINEGFENIVTLCDESVLREKLFLC